MQLFKEIRAWKHDDVDLERVTWIKCFGVPCHAWTTIFFEEISKTVGHYICSDDSTSRLDFLDVASFMIRTRCVIVINEALVVKINDNMFIIKMVEDFHGSGIMMFKKSQVSSEEDVTYSYEPGTVSWEEEDRSTTFEKSDEEDSL